MRIWDLHPGYLARQQLLGEHRELHGLFNILDQNKRGYANHPETKRWVGCESGLRLRHQLLVSEMTLRGYNHHSPLPDSPATAIWPATYVDPPGTQLLLLAGKYAADGRGGRIPLPKNPQQLWAQHKYSVMAHDPNLYRELGKEVAHGRFLDDIDGLAQLLVEALRQPLEPGHLFNALQHMWGYVKGSFQPPDNAKGLLATIRQEAVEQQQPYLLHSTALSELAVWL